MDEKIPQEPQDQENSEHTSSVKSEEAANFENALRSIFSLTPAKAKEIRDKYPEGEDDPS